MHSKAKNGNHTFGLIPLVSPNDDPADAQINVLYPVENITINMPNIGSVCVPGHNSKIDESSPSPN